MKTIAVLFISLVSLFFSPMICAQNYDSEAETVEPLDASVSEYLYVDVYGTGNVKFTMPIDKTITSQGTPVYTQIPVKYGTVPGVGILVTFSVSKYAFITTSDNQTFGISSGEQKQILIKNLSYPQITIQFQN